MYVKAGVLACKWLLGDFGKIPSLSCGMLSTVARREEG